MSELPSASQRIRGLLPLFHVPSLHVPSSQLAFRPHSSCANRPNNGSVIKTSDPESGVAVYCHVSLVSFNLELKFFFLILTPKGRKSQIQEKARSKDIFFHCFSERVGGREGEGGSERQKHRCEKDTSTGCLPQPP